MSKREQSHASSRRGLYVQLALIAIAYWALSKGEEPAGIALVGLAVIGAIHGGAELLRTYLEEIADRLPK